MILTNGILCIISLAFFLILAELFFRFNTQLKEKHSFGRYFQEDYKEDWFSKMDLQISPLLGYEHILGGRNYNSYGLVGPEYPIEKDDHIYRILVLGDSITEHNWYVSSLEEKLNKSFEGSKKFELWNAGVSGYSLSQYARYLESKGFKFKPDLVLIGFCINDVSPTIIVVYRDNKKVKEYFFPAMCLVRYVPVNRLCFKYSFLYRFITIRLDSFLARREKRCSIEESSTVFYLDKIQDLCKKQRVLLVCAIFPYMKPLGEYSEEELIDYKTLKNALQELKIHCVDLSEYFPEDRRYSLRRWTNDFKHPNEEGHEIAANAIYEDLAKFLNFQKKSSEPYPK